jgi:anti-sigma regulatory factor (Ser/Thr protein kinase)
MAAMSDHRVVAAVSTRADVAIVSRKAQTLARQLGFDQTAVDEIGLVVTELGTNLVKHAGGGTLVLEHVPTEAVELLEIRTEDDGPGIADPEWALIDGSSTCASLGLGLGTVNRLVDHLEITSPVTPAGGTRVVCRRSNRTRARPRVSPLDVGVATRPRFGESDNGDAFIVVHSDHEALVGVIDGLGHGRPAHIAAETARHYVEARSQLSFEDLFRGVDRACRATRGVVMALARIQFDASALLFASVGNIEARVLSAANHVQLIARRGVLGMNALQPRVTRLSWDAQSVLVLHSDGLTTHWQWESLSAALGEPSSVIARQLLRSLARPQDDATVLVAKWRDRRV